MSLPAAKKSALIRDHLPGPKNFPIQIISWLFPRCAYWQVSRYRLVSHAGNNSFSAESMLTWLQWDYYEKKNESPHLMRLNLIIVRVEVWPHGNKCTLEGKPGLSETAWQALRWVGPPDS